MCFYGIFIRSIKAFFLSRHRQINEEMEAFKMKLKLNISFHLYFILVRVVHTPSFATTTQVNGFFLKKFIQFTNYTYLAEQFIA